MSLYSSNFLDLFSNDEVREMSLDINGAKKTIYIRRLSYRVCSMFRHKSQQMVYRAEFDAVMNHEKHSFAFFKEDLEMSEFYLLRKSLCDQTGKVIFGDDDDDKFEAFLNIVTDDIGNDILTEILKFNHIIDFDKTDSIKKK